jgi:protein-L-isoaspartate(D-aspartate) O-methyltransferase
MAIMKDFEAARARLIALLSSEIKDKRVLAAMTRIPREIFVPEESRNLAYEDGPLPIGWEQTISQPYIIALMTEALELTGKEKVLEIGTGSGYQTAILAELSSEVISVERVPALAESAQKVLDSLGYNNIEIHLAEETLGWQKGAPYDAILVTAGAPGIPDDLIAQLADGGRMVIPAGSRYIQELYKVTKNKDGTRVEKLGGCRFVALIGKDAWEN